MGVALVAAGVAVALWARFILGGKRFTGEEFGDRYTDYRQRASALFPGIR